MNTDNGVPVAWLKHGPYKSGEPLVCVFDEPFDVDFYSALYPQDTVDKLEARERGATGGNAEIRTPDPLDVARLHALIDNYKNALDRPGSFNRPIARMEIVNFFTAHDAELRARIDELEMVCDETYQVVGSLSNDLGDAFDHDKTMWALDNLAAHKIIHDDVLPYPSFSKANP